MSEKYLVDASDWSTVEELLPKKLEQMSEAHGFVSSDERGDEKDVSVAVKLRMMLCLAANSLSLRTTVALFAAAGVVSVSHVALHQWFRKAGAFLSALMAELIEANRVFAPERWAGYRVRAVDATTVERPGAKGVTARVHYMLELNSMLVPQVLVTDDKGGETFRNFRIDPGTLVLGDRGYCNPPSIAAAVARKGDVLVRWNYGSTPLQFEAGRRVDAVRLTRTIRVEGQAQEWAVSVIRRNGAAPIPCRLIVTKLPPAQAAESRARLRKTSDVTPTHQALYLAGFVMLVTTVPQEKMSADVIAELYRLRWQIELEFKRQKSIGELDRLPNFLPTTIESWLVAKLIVAELSRRLFFEPASSKAGGSSNRTPQGGNSDGDETPSSEGDLASPLHAQAPWEMKVLGDQVLRRCLLALPKGREALRQFGRRFVEHLRVVKAAGARQRSQIPEFLALLRERQLATG